MFSAVFSAAGLSGARGGFVLFEDVSFNLEPGGALLLRGANGSGKSTLLRILAGLMQPEHGSVEFSEIDLEPPARHYLGHANAIKLGLTVEQNVWFWAGFAGESDSERAQKADDALLAFDLDYLRDLPARYLSAGQKRRLALARLLASPAPLWLLDEPVTALDSNSVRLFEHAVSEHRRQGGIAVVATHQDLDIPGASALMLGEK